MWQLLNEFRTWDGNWEEYEKCIFHNLPPIKPLSCEEFIEQLEKKYIVTLKEETKQLFNHCNKIPLGVDMDGEDIFPGDFVLRDGREDLEEQIEYGTYREKFDCGYVVGYYVPDWCKKVK